MARLSAPQPVTDVPATLGESPLWDDRIGALIWVDIPAGALHRFDPDEGDRIIATLDVALGAVAPRSAGGYVAAAGSGFWYLDDTGEAQHVGDVDDRGERMNDGKCDPQGRFWAGTMTADREPGAALYCLEAGGDPHTAVDNVCLSNGLGWSLDATTMYYVDTPTRRIDTFEFDPDSGRLGERRCFVDFADVRGNPDGLTVDAEGGVWVAMARGSAVRRYLPDGRLDRVIDLPVTRVTSVTFGGADLGDLYITTSRAGLTEADIEEQPQAGLLFHCRPGVTGLPADTYAG